MPDSELLPVARANGVLYAHVVPQAGQGGVISGQSALIQHGWLDLGGDDRRRRRWACTDVAIDATTAVVAGPDAR